MENKGFQLNEKGYLNNCGVDIMAFSDFYPAGHQSGVTLIMNGKRLAANGDVRFEQTPGQWQPIPKQEERKVYPETNTIVTKLSYPNMENHLHGFNPMIYPDFEFSYEVVVRALVDGAEVIVNLDRPIANEFAGKLSFNLELFPGEMFGKSWIMDEKTGVFPRQANAPTCRKKANYEMSGKMRPNANAHADMEKLSGGNKGYNPIIADDLIALPYASGKTFTVCPEDVRSCFTIENMDGQLNLYDGRMNHNNGWFVVNAEIPSGKTEKAIHLVIRPQVDPSWIYPAVVQISQVGYHPAQPKTAIIELDRREENRFQIRLEKITANGRVLVKEMMGKEWGKFLRYQYLQFDFSDVKEEGLYQITYGKEVSSVFRIASDLYERGVWQPVLEYFLPVQMCHMRVNEKYRVWHGRCHCDDGRMAPVNYEQFDGAAQGPSTLTKYQPGDHIEGLNAGGWHDAGDFDLRIESQTGEMYILSTAYEEFHVYVDETTIDQENKVVEIHQPDGKNDILQQIEHGALSVVGAYRSLGRLYHEIMSGNLRQYVLLGDASTMTSGVPGGEDERLVFTEDNPARELTCAAHLAGSFRALKDLNRELAEECLKIAEELFVMTGNHAGEVVKNDYDSKDKEEDRASDARIFAAAELLISTGKKEYADFLIEKMEVICKRAFMLGWMVCRCKDQLTQFAGDAWISSFREALGGVKEYIEKESANTPYGIPYRPNIWGAGWGIQGMANQYFFLHKAFPDIFDAMPLYHALEFILGCHPGSNTASFASGVGTKSATVAYGANRADWSYIPGGVISGTAMIQPDFPELLEFPYLWQQTEYVLGGGSSHYLFLVLAVAQELAQISEK